MNNDEVIEKFTKNLIKIVDTLEQRISTLEKSIGHLTKRYAEVRQHLEGDNNEQS